jgi:NAD(P)-dependent dehydrogenase (short-subunit alcohol dehydrogenase family)
MLTRTAGLELARHNILVVGVGPGAVATPINVGTMNDPAKLAQLNAAIPLGRMARPERSRASSVFSPEAARAISPRPLSLRTAASCIAASACSGPHGSSLS